MAHERAPLLRGESANDRYGDHGSTHETVLSLPRSQQDVPVRLSSTHGAGHNTPYSACSGYNTLRGIRTRVITPAEMMQRSRYAHEPNRGDPGPYVEDLYAPLQAEERIYESVLQHQIILSSIRNQPWPLAQKKQYRRLMKISLQSHVDRLNTIDSINHSGHQAVRHATRSLRHIDPGFSGLWSEKIKQIEGHFGTGVASYFIFLRSLFFFNIFSTMIIIPFIVIPQLLVGRGFTSVDKGDDLEALYNSPVFYGYYDNSTSLGFGYDMPLAYLTAQLAVFAVCFIAVLRVMSKRYRNSKRIHSTNQDCPFSTRAFCSWDHSISKEEASVTAQASIMTSLKEELREAQEAARKLQKVSFWVLSLWRVVSNVIVLIILAGSSGIVYVFVKRAEDRTAYSSDSIEKFAQQFELPFIMAVLKLIGPLLFEQLVQLEHYHPRTALTWTLLRTMVLYLGNLAVLTVTLLVKATQQRCDDSTAPCPTAVSQRAQKCWESTVGEELFKVALIDFGAILLAVLVADVIRALCVGYCTTNSWLREKVGFAEFQIAVSVLDLVYGQGLVWIGAFFCPFLPLIAVVKLTLLFYIRIKAAMFANVAPVRMFRASRSGNNLLSILLVTLFLCLLPIGYTLSEIAPSTQCGPFRHEPRAYNALTVYFSSAANSVISLIGTPAIILPMAIFLGILIYYCYLRIAASREIIKDLEAQLHFERTEGRRAVHSMAHRDQQGRQTGLAGVDGISQEQLASIADN